MRNYHGLVEERTEERDTIKDFLPISLDSALLCLSYRVIFM